MNPAIGVVGVLIFGLGGFLMFEGLYQISNGNDVGIIGFMSFLLIGLGLWIITLSGRVDETQKAS